MATWDTVYRQRAGDRPWERIFHTIKGERMLALLSSDRLPERILVGTTRGIYVSENSGRSWTYVPVSSHEYSVGTMAEDPVDPSTILIGTPRGLFRWAVGVEDHRWDRVGGGLPPLSVSVIQFNPSNPREVIVGDFRQGGLYRSLDQGKTWRRVDSGLTNFRVYCLSYNTNQEPTLYVGTYSNGVYIGQIQAQTTGQVDVGEGKSQ
jgi:photosystem II stability/assembly factor-like uncharacterized protein